MEWQLPESEEHFRLALEAVRMGTWEWTPNTGMLSADAVHQSLFGLSPQSEPLFYPAGDLIDQQPFYLANVLALDCIDWGAFDPITGNER